MDSRFYEISMRGWNGEKISRDECKYLLGFPENSPEAIFLSSLADRYMKTVTNRTAILNVQIGIQLWPCPGNCGFCNFNKTSCKIAPYLIDEDELTSYVKESVSRGDVRTISLMTMHNLDLDHLLRCIRLSKKIAGPDVKITVNTGDVSYEDCLEMKAAGASGAYHACRLREGKDTDLDPIIRWQTLRNYLDAGFVVSTCTEPIGPEHSLDEILDNYYYGMELGADSGSVMARVPVPGTRLGNLPVMTQARMRQLRSALFISSLASERKEHRIDPWKCGYFNGLNRFHGEYGGNPRDREEKSETGFGFTVEFARNMAYLNGYDHLMKANGKMIDLNPDYLSDNNYN